MEDEHHHHKSHKHKPPSHFNFINQNHNHNHNHSNELSIFPPINHEDLPIPPPPPPPPLPPHAPLTIDSDDHPSPPPPNKHNNNNYTHLINWVNFALHFWNSKLLSFLSHPPCIGLFSSFRFVAATASFLGFVWFWFQRRRQTRVCGGGGGGEESVEHLKAVIKAKDEKILQLLEQIAHMNKVMLAHYKNPVSKTS